MYKTKRTTFTRSTLILFVIVSIYIVLPLIEVPLLGLSISAPFFFLIVLEVIFRPPQRWSKVYRPLIMLTVLIWIGVFISASANGLLSGGVNINTGGILTVIQYAYWLLIFNVVAYVVSVGNLPSVLVRIFGWSIFILAILRWGEAIVYGSIGAEFRLEVMAQNSYGFQFSAFSPYLFGIALIEKGWMKRVAVVGNILLWGAIAINGSRGSWVAVGVELALVLVILMAARQRRVWGLAVLLLFTGSIAFLVFSASPQISQAVESRLNTFQNLDEEKSYPIRQLMNQKSLLLFKQSPIFGIGVARFTVSSVELEIPKVLQYGSQEHFNRKSAHNSYLSFLAETGLAGVIPLAILLIFLTTAGLRAAILLARQDQYWGVVIYTSFIGASVHMWVISNLVNTSTWFIYGLVAAMIVIVRTTPMEKSK